MLGTIKFKLIQSTSIVITLLLLLSFVCCSCAHVEMFEIVYSNNTILRDKVIEILNKYPNFVNKRFGVYSRTPLHMTIQNGNMEFTKQLKINLEQVKIDKEKISVEEKR